jgi:hypothetical protein
MGMSHIHYLPLAPRFFAILVGFFFIVLILRSVCALPRKSGSQNESLPSRQAAVATLVMATAFGKVAFHCQVADNKTRVSHLSKPSTFLTASMTVISRCRLQ